MAGSRLGDRTVHRIGLGTKRLPRGPGVSAADRTGAVRLLRRAVELGVDHLDTAAFYPSLATETTDANEFTSLGIANELVREALAPYAADAVLVATKVGPTERGLARPDQLRALVEADLRALGRERLDLVYLRQAGLADVGEHYGVLAELRAAGLIAHLGLSNVRAEHLDQARAIAPVVAVSNRYGVDFGRVNDDLVTACARRARRSSRSSRPPVSGARSAGWPRTRRWTGSPEPGARHRRRSGWRGC